MTKRRRGGADMDEAQPTNLTPTAAPESSAPVSDTSPSPTPSSTAPSNSGRPSRGRNGRRQSAPPATQDEKFSQSMEAVWAKSAGGQQSAPAPGEPTAEEIYARRGAAVDALTAGFDDLPAETKEYIRQSLDRPPMPQAWGQDKSELWGKLDRSAQEYLLQRELEAQQKITSQGNEIAELKKSGGHA